MTAVAVKTSDKTSDKSSKSSAKDTSKVFDVSKPNKQPSSATSRPVIVTNRPIMQDPMMASNTKAVTETSPETETEASPSKVKMTIQPLSDGTDADKDAADTSAGSETDTATAASNAEETAKAEDTKAAEPAEESDSSGAETSDTPDTGDDLPLAGDQTKTEKETAELEAAAKKQAELDTIAESKEYFLPINSVERRRSKLVTLLGAILILALGLLLLNLMLDAGFLRIPGISPLTHFFRV